MSRMLVLEIGARALTDGRPTRPPRRPRHEVEVRPLARISRWRKLRTRRPTPGRAEPA